ncbi:MAG TPA: BrnT family toxin [Deltaproteobacteria bacterium]|nr:BrnT family toxin [Deltaproteobacteria bacterium]
MITFAWDPRKNVANRRKHGVSFDEARTVFYDEHAARYYDPDHSEDEDRFIMLGLSSRLQVLVVHHGYRQDDSVIRIISARKATVSEQQAYWKERP